jgi:hypothetical protein
MFLQLVWGDRYFVASNFSAFYVLPKRGSHFIQGGNTWCPSAIEEITQTFLFIAVMILGGLLSEVNINRS